MKCKKHPKQLCSLGYCMKCQYENKMKTGEVKTITEEVEKWCEGTLSNHMTSRLKDILTGEYDLQEARKDILSIREMGNKGK